MFLYRWIKVSISTIINKGKYLVYSLIDIVSNKYNLKLLKHWSCTKDNVSQGNTKGFLST